MRMKIMKMIKMHLAESTIEIKINNKDKCNRMNNSKQIIQTKKITNTNSRLLKNQLKKMHY